MADRWAVTIHCGGGSMVEAADPRLAMLVASEKVAQVVEKCFNEAIGQHPDRFVRDEWWATSFPIPEAKSLASAVVIPGTQPPQTAVDAVRELSLITAYLEDDDVKRCKCCNLTAMEARPATFGKYADRKDQYWCSACHDNGICGEDGCFRSIMMDESLAKIVRNAKGLS